MVDSHAQTEDKEKWIKKEFYEKLENVTNSTIITNAKMGKNTEGGPKLVSFSAHVNM